MNGRVVKLARKQATQAASATERALAPEIQIAQQNELITRERVGALEARTQTLVAAVHKFSAMSRWERLKWLLR